MRKIILYIANSLDNFIARENGDVDWLFSGGDYGITEFYDSIDTVLIGRKSLEKGNELGMTHYEGKKNYVFSRTLKESRIDEVEYVSEDLAGFVERLKKQEGKNIWLVGGGDLIRQFLDKNLIDEFHFSVHPILLGKGLPLFLPFENQIELELIETKTYEDGLVHLGYARK